MASPALLGLLSRAGRRLPSRAPINDARSRIGGVERRLSSGGERRRRSTPAGQQTERRHTSAGRTPLAPFRVDDGVRSPLRVRSHRRMISAHSFRPTKTRYGVRTARGPEKANAPRSETRTRALAQRTRKAKRPPPAAGKRDDAPAAATLGAAAMPFGRGQRAATRRRRSAARRGTHASGKKGTLSPLPAKGATPKFAPLPSAPSSSFLRRQSCRGPRRSPPAAAAEPARHFLPLLSAAL